MSLRDELWRLCSAWVDYIKDIWQNSDSQKFLLSLVIGVGLSLASFVCTVVFSGSVYAQSSSALRSASVFPIKAAFPWVFYGSLVSIFLGFIRANYRFFKRLLDLVFAGVSLVIFSPLFLIIALLVKADSEGPVFFNQERLGKDRKLFKMWKFRTMRHNAELETGPVWTQDNDPRITRIGQFLRKSHLDELPQLINVFFGDMGLIGPRPERPEFTEEITKTVPKFAERLQIIPGITGLAQTRYPYAASIRDATHKLRYDSLYIRKRSWVLDFQILLWTAGRVLTGEGSR